MEEYFNLKKTTFTQQSDWCAVQIQTTVFHFGSREYQSFRCAFWIDITYSSFPDMKNPGPKIGSNLALIEVHLTQYKPKLPFKRKFRCSSPSMSLPSISILWFSKRSVVTGSTVTNSKILLVRFRICVWCQHSVEEKAFKVNCMCPINDFIRNTEADSRFGIWMLLTVVLNRTKLLFFCRWARVG